LENSSRYLIKILREICAEGNMDFETFSYDWISKLTRGDKIMYICGYHFPLNDASAALICSDKAALSAVLAERGIPCAEHRFFMSPQNLHFTGRDGNWPELCAMLWKNKTLVCKRNGGSGGSGVYLVQSQAELERAVSEIFRTSRSMAVSPFYEIINEYRAVILCGEVRLIYNKIRPYVTGDGGKTVFELMAQKFGPSASQIEVTAELDAVPPDGQRFNLGWKHNLGRGSVSAPVADADLLEKLSRLAAEAAQALKIKFASVDIIQTTADEEVEERYMVLEINSGIMMEKFAASGRDNYLAAKKIYSDAVELYFKQT